MRRSSAAPWGVVLLAAMVCGCGSGNPQTFKVNGTVIYKGKPVTSGVVQLMPDGGGNSAIGTLETDGSFQLTTFKKNDGACPGKYKVTVQAFPDQDDESPTSGLPGMELAGEDKPPIPERYANIATTDLFVNVNQGENTLELELKD